MQEYLYGNPEAVVGFVAFLGAMLTYGITHWKDRKLQQRQHYLQLEFEASRIFQVCVEHPEIPRYLNGQVAADSASDIAERAYWFVCQTLNVFEIIVSFYRDDKVSTELFATWVAWFHEVGTAPRFEEFWRGRELSSHYKYELCEVLDAAVDLRRTRPAETDQAGLRYHEELQALHAKVAAIFKKPPLWSIKRYTRSR